MEYIFGRDDQNGIETLKIKNKQHTDLQGFCEVAREYTDSVITDSFFVTEKIFESEDSEGMCYDWYAIEKHNRTIDRTKAMEAVTGELEKQVTDAQLALAELYELMTQGGQ